MSPLTVTGTAAELRRRRRRKQLAAAIALGLIASRDARPPASPTAASRPSGADDDQGARHEQADDRKDR